MNRFKKIRNLILMAMLPLFVDATNPEWSAQYSGNYWDSGNVNLREIPAAGAPPLELLPQNADEFKKSFVFTSNTAIPERGYGTGIGYAIDKGNQYEDKLTWRINWPSTQSLNLMPADPFKVTPGERVFVSVRIFVERGRPSLIILPWRDGVLETTPFDTGNPQQPTRENDTESWNVWVWIHAYLHIPEGVQGFVPVISAPGGTTYSISEWQISRPSKEELNPAPKKVEGFAYKKERVEEKLDRGLVALRKDRDVYLSWRLLKTDKANVGFNIYRFTPDGKEEKRNSSPIVKTTDFIDRGGAANKNYRWSVRVAHPTGNSLTDASDPVAASELPYISLPLKDASAFNIGFADLDGDGKLDYIIKTPNSSIDPWFVSWNKSPGTYKLQAYKSDGTFLWEHDLGWSIEQGIWYSPYLVADLDGDGCAEIAVKGSSGDHRSDNGRVYSGPEYLMILNGKTGKERTRIDWPERGGERYSWSNRNQLGLAYLDGKTPCIIAIRGTYTRLRVFAHQLLTGPDRLEKLWTWDTKWDKSRWGKGSHTNHAVDLDGDGRDELILGTIALDDDGSVLWEWNWREGPRSDADHFYVGDIDPTRPGLEVVIGIEPPQPKNGICMLDAKTGELIWGVDHPTFHIHSSGMVSPIDAAYPGCLIWSGEERSADERWLRNAKGEILKTPEGFPRQNLAPRSVWWTDDLLRKLMINNSPVHYPSLKKVDATQFEGRILLIGDLFGDWREEVVTCVDSEIRIYSTTIPAKDRRTTFLQDRNYRATLTESTMGYPQIPLPSYDLRKP